MVCFTTLCSIFHTLNSGTRGHIQKFASCSRVRVSRALDTALVTPAHERIPMRQHHKAELCGFSEPSPTGCHSVPQEAKYIPKDYALHSIHNCRFTQWCWDPLRWEGRESGRTPVPFPRDWEEGRDKVSLNPEDQGCLCKEGCLGAEVLMELPRAGFS